MSSFNNSIIQISDLHITKYNKNKIINKVNDLSKKYRFVVVTGDIIDNVKDISLLRRLKQRNNIMFIGGNHDYYSFYGNFFYKKSRKFDEIFTKQYPKTKNVDNYLIIGLNSNNGNFFASGKLGKKQLNELKKIVESNQDKKIIIALHHNPITTKIYKWWNYKNYDRRFMELKDKESLIKIIDKFNNIKFVLYGHRHNSKGIEKVNNVYYCNSGALKEDLDNIILLENL